MFWHKAVLVLEIWLRNICDKALKKNMVEVIEAMLEYVCINYCTK